MRYSFKLMLEERSIEIGAHNLETVVSRATTDTRMRDFYDLHILSQLHGQSIIPADLSWHTVMESIRSLCGLAQGQ